MRITIHTNPEVQLLLERIRKMARLQYTGSAIRKSINIAHIACSHSLPPWRVVLRSEELRQQVDLHVGPGIVMAVVGKNWPAVTTRLTPQAKKQMDFLIDRGFGSDKESVALRSLHLYHEVLAHQNKKLGWQFGIVDDDNEFSSLAI